MTITIVMAFVVVGLLVWSSRQGRDNGTNGGGEGESDGRRDRGSVCVSKVEDGVGTKVSHSVNAKRSLITHGNLELPAHEPNDSLVYNPQGRYTLQYSPYRRAAVWVAYKLTLADVDGTAARSNAFRSDEVLRRRGYAVAYNDDYRASGFDKGHLLPSADRLGSKMENRATFVLSNCSPQLPTLNRGAWKNLEESVRRMCRNYDTLYVVTGTLFDGKIKAIGKNRIAVPDRFFKAVLARKGDGFDCEAYIMPNQNQITKKERYKVSLDSLERSIGIDLFPNVDI